MSEHPLVSCIMPTRDRREFASQAIWYFLYQNYPNRECIIIDDGVDSIRDLIPSDNRFHYIHLKHQTSLGRKLCLAADSVNGDFIAHWDDDDWHSPQRLTIQMKRLLEHGSTISAIRPVLIFNLLAGEVWLSQREDNIHPGTLVCQSSLWKQYFRDQNIDPDLATFVEMHEISPAEVIHDSDLYVAILHEDNRRSTLPVNHLWQRQPFEKIATLLDTEQHFYISLRDSKCRNNNKSVYKPPVNEPAITLAAPFMTYDGYGSMAEYLALSLIKSGAKINIKPLMIDEKGLTPTFCKKLHESRIYPNDPVIFFCWPNGDLDQYFQNPNLFINTMWESSRLPAGWVEKLNHARAVIVPSQFVSQTFRDNGVFCPIHIIPEGVDPDVYTYVERPQTEGITTLIVGTLIERKHWREAITGWQMAFGDDPSARLLIKSRFGHSRQFSNDSRIRLVDDNETTRGILHWYQQADILLALGSEGFGLPLVEGMATGLPVVALNAEGQSDICTQAKELVLSVQPKFYASYIDNRFGDCGKFAIPDVEQVATHLSWIATHRQEASHIGKLASQWVRKHRNIWSKGAAVLDVIENDNSLNQTFRRLPTVWLPSWSSKCGIAEYTYSLTNNIPNVRIVKDYAGDRPAEILHVQHQHSLYDEYTLLKKLQRTKQQSCPILITEHSIGEHVEPWERYADCLVSLTSKGAAQLKQRWPNKDIRHIPMGAPTWFPERKKKRGNVIGVFGFLERHKGFWHLLDVLKQNSDISLQAFSYARSKSLLHQWQQDSDGLPVVHITKYLSEQEIAFRLASEADIIVYWYDEVPFYSASSALRVGLASGVPVLTSPTSWFYDLRDVTYQPQDLYHGVLHLLEDDDLRQRLTESARDYCHATSWANITQQHLSLWSDYRR